MRTKPTTVWEGLSCFPKCKSVSWPLQVSISEIIETAEEIMLHIISEGAAGSQSSALARPGTNPQQNWICSFGLCMSPLPPPAPLRWNNTCSFGSVQCPQMTNQKTLKGLRKKRQQEDFGIAGLYSNCCPRFCPLCEAVALCLPSLGLQKLLCTFVTGIHSLPVLSRGCSLLSSSVIYKSSWVLGCA